MDPVALKNRFAAVVMASIIAFNIVLAVNFLAAADSALALTLNSKNIFVLAGIELMLLFAAYLVAKFEPIPTPS